jgi:hypothetical protein
MQQLQQRSTSVLFVEGGGRGQTGCRCESWSRGCPGAKGEVRGHAMLVTSVLSAALYCVSHISGVFVTREHVRHNKSNITHRGRARIHQQRQLPHQVEPLCSSGQSLYATQQNQ